MQNLALGYMLRCKERCNVDLPTCSGELTTRHCPGWRSRRRVCRPSNSRPHCRRSPRRRAAWRPRAAWGGWCPGRGGGWSGTGWRCSCSSPWCPPTAPRCPRAQTAACYGSRPKQQYWSPSWDANCPVHYPPWSSRTSRNGCCPISIGSNNVNREF